LVGGAGADFLVGGLNRDIMTGGTQVDTFFSSLDETGFGTEPFAAPALATGIVGELTPQDAMTRRLLHLEGKIVWAAWFDLKERATRESWLTAGATFANARSLLLAAGQGLGIALAPVQFAQPMVDAGTLLPIGTRRWREATRYRMIVNHDPADAAYVLPVRDWLRQRSRRPWTTSGSA
jgi:DNA-binding transcriptional LysR family regulator